MTLTYDIDISYVTPPDAFSNARQAAMLGMAGISLNARKNYVAKFRDPNTAAALRGASAEVKAYFTASGFALTPSGVPLPAGVFDKRFDGHLADVAQRLRANLDRFDLQGQDWNGFAMGGCIAVFGESRAVDVQRMLGGQPRKGGMRRFLPAFMAKSSAQVALR